MQDAFHGARRILRNLARSPGFALMAVLTLALGIGGNTAVFSVINGVLLEPLPFPEPDRLVGVWHTAPGMGFELANQSPALHFTYQDNNRVFERVGMWDETQITVTGLDRPERLSGMRVTEGTLPLLGVQPVLGRLFTPGDDSPGTAETVILSHGYWQSRFGARPGVIGETLTVDGSPREIIGVLPAELQFLDYDPVLFLPFRFDLGEVYFGNFSYQGVARLHPGVTIEQANEDIARMIPLATARFPMPPGFTEAMLAQAGFGPNIRPLKLDVVGNVGDVLWLLLGTVGLVLLVACANVANLFLVRAESRQQELAIRTALGAGRFSLARLFLGESLSLGMLGGVVGLWLAWAGIRLLGALDAGLLPRLDEVRIDATVLAFDLGVSLLAGLLFGLFPLLRLGSGRLAHALKESGRGMMSGRERHRARNALVISQVAMAIVLLVGSGLMIRSFVAMRAVDPGFLNPEEVLTVRVSIPSAEVEDPAEVARTHEAILRRLEQLPGVTSVGASSSVTMDQWQSHDPIFVEEFPEEGETLPPLRRYKWVMPGYTETMGNQLLAGRTITWADLHDRTPVVAVTASFVRDYWSSPAEALGKRVRPNPDGEWREIVGVVGDVRDDGTDRDPVDIVYWPMVVSRFWDEELYAARSMAYAIRSSRSGTVSLLEEVRQAVWQVNPNLPLANVQTLDEIARRMMARAAFTLVMLAIAGAVALLLGAVGIYGLISYTVAQRTREIGVRMALGARQQDVSLMVLRRALLLVAVGVAVGLAAAAGLTRLMAALLYGVSPFDPITFATVAVFLAVVAIAASYIPARRAARIDPVQALRRE